MTYKEGTTMEAVKVQLIEEALDAFGGCKIHTAKALQISVRMIRNYVLRYDQLSRFRVPQVGGRKPPPEQLSLFR